MAETFCGKSCADCLTKKELNCPGCRFGPGRSISGECDLAQCCRSRGHETCGSCSFKVRCGKYMRKEKAPDDRLRRMNAEKERIAENARRAPTVARWMSVLFWLVIPSLIGSLFTSDTTQNWIPGFYIPALLLQYGSSIIYGVVLLMLSKLENGYRTAGILMLISPIVSILMLFIGSMDAAATLFIFTIPMLIVQLIAIYLEFHAHADIMSDMDDNLSNLWLGLWKWTIGMYALTFGSLIVMVINPVLGVIAMLAGLVGTVGVGIIKEVLLFKSARAAKQYAIIMQGL